MTLLDAPSNGLIPYWVGAFWAEHAWDVLPTIGNLAYFGADGLPVDNDETRPFYDSDLSFVLQVNFTEERLRNRATWMAFCEATLGWLHTRHLTDRCVGIQFGDELYSWLTHTERHPHWPTLATLPPIEPGKPRLYLMPILSDYLAARAADMRAVFGSDMRPIGTSETGGVDPPIFDGCDWIGVNAYLPSPITRAGFDRVAAVYKGAASKGRPLMTVLPMAWGTDENDPLKDPPTLWQMAWYLELVDRYRPFALMYFCLHHPTIYNPAHGKRAYGLTDMPEMLATLQTLWTGRTNHEKELK